MNHPAAKGGFAEGRSHGKIGRVIESKNVKLARVEAKQAQVNAIRQAYMLASRYNREQPYEEVWSEPVMAVAKKYGLSDVGLAKICKKLNIPRPDLGYWAKKAVGKPVGQPPPLAPSGEWD